MPKDTNKFRPLKAGPALPGQKKPMAELTFRTFTDGSVNATGPIEQPELVLDIVGRGLIAISKHLAKKKLGQNGGIVPVESNLILPGRG